MDNYVGALPFFQILQRHHNRPPNLRHMENTILKNSSFQALISQLWDIVHIAA